MPKWVWDSAKDLANRRKHGVALADGIPALSDPFALSVPDPHVDDDRWRTIGMAEENVLLFVVHTEPTEQSDGQEIGRLISVRKAEKRDRIVYENRHSRFKKGPW